MKNFLLFSACVMLAFASCKKDAAKTTTTNTITATVGGTNVNFSTGAIAQLGSDSGAYILEVQGVSGTGSSAQPIIVGLVSEAPIVKGTYTFNSSTDPNATVFPDITYAKSLSGSAADVFVTDIYFDAQSSTISTTTTVTITSISSTNVQGTFSGVLINEADDTITETVTNGKFNLAISTIKLQAMNSRISAARMQSFKNRLKN
ncbi:hypothetical protein [Mucilaginibacter sp.]